VTLPGLDASREEVDLLVAGLDAAPDFAFAARADGRLRFVNRAARARWPEAVVGAEAAALFPEPARATFLQALAALRAGGEPARFEWGDEGPAGSRSWFACTLSPLGDGGGYLCLSSDATVHKQSEERLRRSEQLMVDTQGVAHLGTWEWDVSQPTATWSGELYRIYGLTPESYTPSYEKYLTLVHPDDRQRVIDATNRVFHEQIPYSHDERIVRPDGSLRHLHTWAHPVLDDAGRLVRLVGVCQDITDRKTAEEQVHQLNADLERRVAERTRTIENTLRDLEAFNAMASHDLRAPLAVIQGSCSLIFGEIQQPADSSGPYLPSVIQNLTRIQQSVTYMASLLNDLLTLAQVGNAPLDRGPIDLSALCLEVVANLRRSSPGRDVVVSVEPCLRCHGDRHLVRAALENLIGNAWKYSSRVATARIEVGAVEQDGRRVFFVRDNGAGFDMKDAHRLFAPFQRLHKASEFAGTGVGLAAVHRIIERHGGRVWAESARGSGATFFVELPAG
jgi:PAS domain S-box-containing protein